MLGVRNWSKGILESSDGLQAQRLLSLYKTNKIYFERILADWLKMAQNLVNNIFLVEPEIMSTFPMLMQSPVYICR